MSLLLNTPPELEQRLRDEAARAGMDTHAYAVSLLEKNVAPVSTPARPVLTPDERRAERAKLLKYAGCFNSGDPRSADNERIDADLAAEYGRGLDREA